jgi:hypothetical protein
MDTNEFNLLGTIALAGAVFMVVGVFLGWMKIDLGFGDPRFVTGWQIATDSDYSRYIDYTYAPTLCLVCGVA